MKDEIKEILEKLKDNIPQEEYRSEGTSDGMTHYEEDKDSWQYKLYDYITNLQILYDKTTTDLVKESHARMKLQEENDYLKDIVSNTELSDEIKKADKYSKRELYKINYQRLKANQRLQEENERLKNGYCELKERCNNGECDCTNEEYEIMGQSNMKLLLENDKLQKENKRLKQMVDWNDKVANKKQERIDKAIDKLYCYGEVFDGKILQQFQKEMLNILQGSDKE